MEKVRVLLLPALLVLAILSACAEYPDPAAACNGLPIGRAPRHDQGLGPHPVRVYLRDDPDAAFTKSDQHPLADTLLFDLGSEVDSEIALVACVTVTPTDLIITCGYGYDNQHSTASGLAPDPTVAALDAARQPVTVEFHSGHYELSLRSARTGEELAHQSFDIPYARTTCPSSIEVSDDQPLIIRTPDIANDPAFYNSIAPYVDGSAP